MKIRKQVYELTLEDLAKYPVWEFALDEEDVEGQDEATVRPHSISGALNPSQGVFVVAACFTLADGSTMRGYITPPADDEAGLDTVQPQIVTECGQVGFWCGAMEPDAATRQGFYNTLGKQSDAVFPVGYESSVRLTSGPVSGTIPGFIFLERDFTTQRI